MPLPSKVSQVLRAVALLAHDVNGTLDHIPVCRGRFVLPSQYAMVMFEQPPVAGCSGAAYLQMHLTAAPVTCVLNSPNYEALLSFTKVNILWPVHACACDTCHQRPQSKALVSLLE